MFEKLPDQPSGPRRNRHGRGRRGPLIPMHVPAYRTRPERFDDAVMASAQRLAQRWESRMVLIDFRILPVPSDKLLDLAHAAGDRVPLSSSRAATATERARVSIYRLPLEQLASSTVELVDLVHQCIVHEVSELWMIPVNEVDPEYFPEDPDF
ncbi:metallopeptidase family protein [Glutamicibacter sp.]|uniref:metallopeptidase family protein n=1 Tax=Glutamicibacter sp. TaxID=1931995 RepID=UPI0028BE0FCD|nr:metallopeptidase family protein [Glutamicibacter sp.]